MRHVQREQKLMQFNLNKRGVSPLIATVLLIGFTIALAVVIMNWGLDFAKDITKGTSDKTKQALKCTNDLDFKIESVDCASNKVVIDNGRSTVDVVKFIIQVHSGDTVTPFDTGTGIPAYGKAPFTVPSLTGVGKVVVTAFIPGAAGQEPISCAQAPREYEISPVC